MLALLIAFALVQAEAQQKCRALSLEGGGSHGAYEAGCLQVLVESLPAEDVEWDVITGISIGAFNTGLASQFPKGEESAMVDMLLEYWINFNTSSTAYKQWPGGYVEGLTIKSSLLDGSPGGVYYRRYFKHLPERKASVGTVNLDTGVFTDFDESLSFEEWGNAVSASGSPPLYFPPVYFRDSWWVDGGVAINLDVFSAIERCLEVVDNQADVIVDMIYDDHQEALDPETSFNSLEVFNRVRSIQSADSSNWYYYNARIAYPQAQFRYLLVPSEQLPGGFLPLDFNRPDVEWEIQLGRNDTQKVLTGSQQPRETPAERRKRQTIYATD